MLRLGDHREVRRRAEPRRLRLADPHAARTGHPGRLRAAQVREREDARQRAASARPGGEGRTCRLNRLPPMAAGVLTRHLRRRPSERPMPPELQSPEIQAFAIGFPTTLLHAGVAILILVLAAALYIVLTPHKEVALIREGNAAAAVSLGGVLVGLAAPLALSLNSSTSLIEICVWGVSTVMVQLLVFRLV